MHWFLVSYHLVSKLLKSVNKNAFVKCEVTWLILLLWNVNKTIIDDVECLFHFCRERNSDACLYCSSVGLVTQCGEKMHMTRLNCCLMAASLFDVILKMVILHSVSGVVVFYSFKFEHCLMILINEFSCCMLIGL